MKIGILLQAGPESLQTPFIVFSVLILAALIIGALSYMQLSNRFYKQKDELRKAEADLKKAARFQRKYNRARKAAEKAKRINGTIKEAMDAGRITVYSIDLAEGKVKFGKNINQVLGLDAGGSKRLGLENLDKFRSFVHPNDLPTLEMPPEPMAEPKTPFENYYRLLLPGGPRWIKSSGEILSRGGKAYKILGIIQDVSHMVDLTQDSTGFEPTLPEGGTS